LVWNEQRKPGQLYVMAWKYCVCCRDRRLSDFLQFGTHAQWTSVPVDRQLYYLHDELGTN